jgi:serine/threonine protein kinase
MDGKDPWGEGHVIANKFKLIRQLGRGGMGSVWAADHLALNSRVAIKIIDPAIATSPDALARFLREAQSAAALRSPHVVQTLDYGVDDGVPFIAMELLEGESLADRLDRVGRLPIVEVATIMTQVCRAMARAHEGGVVHRDLKPDNIFLVKNDDEEIAKVLDFGIAKTTGAGLGTSSQTRTGAILGTPYYMSPEQVEGNRNVDHRADLWSLAIIGFEALCGKRPFESEALGDLILQICVRPIRAPSSVAEVPPGFDQWFARGTTRDVAQRFQSAREMSAQLREIAGLPGKGTETAKGLGRSEMGSLIGIPAPTTGFGQTPQPGFAQTPQPAFKQTTGGVGAVTQSNVGRAQTSTPLVIGATVGAVLLAGVVGLLVFHSSSHPPEAPSAVSAQTAPNETAAPVAAPTTPPPATASAEPPSVVPVPPTTAVVAETPPSVAPAPAVHANPTARPVAKSGAPHAAPTAKPKPAKHVDFGF